ncbi:hypothetical protein BC567DRAFT_3370 [Phyllosticta citribraziliensis]
MAHRLSGVGFLPLQALLLGACTRKKHKKFGQDTDPPSPTHIYQELFFFDTRGLQCVPLPKKVSSFLLVDLDMTDQSSLFSLWSMPGVKGR